MELRVYFSGLSGDQDPPDVSDSRGHTFGARYFSFTFFGRRYRAFSYAFLRLPSRAFRKEA
jgi:hypothetical protein